MKKITEQTLRKIGKKVIPVILWIIIPLLLLTDILLTKELINNWTSRIIIEKILVMIGLLFIFLFAYFLFVSIVKYKKQLFLKDKNRSRQFKKFDNKFRNFEILFFIYLIFLGAITSLIGKNLDNIFLVLIGSAFLFLVIKRKKGRFWE